jgi:hypothetical protein
MTSKSRDDQYSEQETVRRADAALKRMFSTPHKPHKPLGKKKMRSKRKVRK